MSTLEVNYNHTARIARVNIVSEEEVTVPDGYIPVGNFEHPDPVYPDSLVIYHGVRELLYKRSHANPAVEAKYPFNIVNMGAIQIVFITPDGDEVPAGSLLFDEQPILIDGSELVFGDEL